MDGLDVTLTIDARIQQIAEEEAMAALERHGAKRVTVVAMDPETGDVLATCSVPGLDLSDSSDRPRDGSTCAALQEIYPPGSTFKPLMMATALQLGLAHPDEPPLDCRAFDGPRRIRDTHPKQDPLSLEEIIVHSSNSRGSTSWDMITCFCRSGFSLRHWTSPGSPSIEASRKIAREAVRTSEASSALRMWRAWTVT